MAHELHDEINDGYQKLKKKLKKINDVFYNIRSQKWIMKKLHIRTKILPVRCLLKILSEKHFGYMS